MIKVNEYFEGKVKSLGNELKGRPFSVGIIKPGEYTLQVYLSGELLGEKKFELGRPLGFVFCHHGQV